MRRSGSLVRSLVALAALVGIGCPDSEDRPGVPPNVILISLDTLRYDHCSFNGYARETTPFLDELAQRSVVFDRAYATYAWTLISHMSMLTGLYSTQHGVTTSNAALNPGFPTLAQRLLYEGYRTMGIYANNWVGPRHGFARGFDRYEAIRSIDDAEELLPEMLADVRPDHPYFLFVHLFDIHSASFNKPVPLYDPPAPYDSMFVADARAQLEGIDWREWWDVGAEPTLDQHEAIVALYDGGIRHVDDRLREWFASWEQRGLLDNTIVIITSDHGEGLRQRSPRYGGHGGNYEEGLRVPLLIRLPDERRAGEHVETVVSHVDLVPTILRLAGIESDARLPGIDLLDDARGPDEWVFAAGHEPRLAVSRDAKLHYQDDAALTLYRLAEDPDELNPISIDPSDDQLFSEAEAMMRRIREQLAAHYDAASAVRAEDLDAASRAKLEALGYGAELK